MAADLHDQRYVPRPPETWDPVVGDLSLYVRGGRLHSSRAVIDDAVEAEQLGLCRVWLSERYDLKEAGALLGGMGAVTSRIGPRPPAAAAPARASGKSSPVARYTVGTPGENVAAEMAAAVA